ncbi:hypothetical protein NM208_g1796 [Fusarium decemcellulare]|uniref:Uncharacterized protein n=1 Tax=Fusarium decemcellulare TaxID=57161 RepID=A0ACC1SV12_9HYPO|nr:hypothetical protein NM208_g1796 [Fusarium decemcellulare]
MGRWMQPLLLTASVFLSLPNAGSALPAQDPSQDDLPVKAGEIPPVLPPIAYRRQDAPEGVNTPPPAIPTTEGGSIIPAEPVETATTTVPFEELSPSRTLMTGAASTVNRWKAVDAGDAWTAVIDGWKANITAGREQKHFSNNVSNFFHGPQDMFCETFSDEGSGCEDLNLQCHSVSAPAGYFILHSFENIFAMHSNIWNAVGDAVRDNDIGSIADEFGKVPPKEGGLAASILIDIALMSWGIVMGPAWNKLIGPKFSDGTNAGTLKDTTNDLVKNSLTLTKDILNSRAQDQLGVQNGLTAQMQALAEGWKDSILGTQKWLFGGSEDGYNQLGGMISDASMFGDGWLLDRADHAKQPGNTPPDVIYPFIAESDVACDKDPGWNHGASFTSDAQYWLEENTLKNGTPIVTISEDMPIVECLSPPPGFQSLVDKKFTDITLANVIVGSINSKNANGGKNGFKLDMNEPSRETLESLAGTGIESPGVFNIPICSMDEVMENYLQWFQNDHEDMTNFPCNP